MTKVSIATNRSVNGVDFGCPESIILTTLTQRMKAASPVDINAGRAIEQLFERRVNFNAEVELQFAGAIYRVQQHRFVEATFPAHGDNAYSAEIDGVVVVSVFDWLAGQNDVVDVARFRVSEQVGIAYDYRNPATGSFTVFAPGHWAGLMG